LSRDMNNSSRRDAIPSPRPYLLISRIFAAIPAR
jgi:hypothetical protein